MDSSKQPQSEPETKAVTAKTPYEAPKLVIHGSVQQITQSVAGAPNDGVAGSLTISDN